MTRFADWSRHLAQAPMAARQDLWNTAIPETKTGLHRQTGRNAKR